MREYGKSENLNLASFQVVDLLMKQKARRIFMMMVLEKDKRSQSHAKHLLADVQSDVQHTMGDFHQRKQFLEGAENERKNLNANVINEKNLSLLYRIMNGQFDAKPYDVIYYKDLLGSCRQFLTSMDEVSAAVEKSRQKQIEKSVMQ